MFALTQTPDGKWVVTWGGEAYPQTPLDTREQAESRLQRLQQRYPLDSFQLVLDAGKDRRGGPYNYRFDAEYADYLEGTPIKVAGISGARTKAEAKDNLRYRMKVHGITEERIRSLMAVLELEAV
jgi:hypothetical protein